MGNHKTSESDAAAAAAAAAALLLTVALATQHLSHTHAHSTTTLLAKILYKNASVRPPVLITATIAGWAAVVSVCRNAQLNLEAVLGGPLQHPTATLRQAATLAALVASARLFHVLASEYRGLTWRPWLVANLALHLAFALVALQPSRTAFGGASRVSLLRTLYESVIAPFAPVTFWHVIVADYLTSMAKLFSDLQLSACISYSIAAGGSSAAPEGADGSYVRSTTLWAMHHQACADTGWNALMLALPFWWRLMQCIKVYSVTREQKNLWNALKYSTAFPLVYAGYLRRHEPSAAHDAFFIGAAVVQSTYCFIWDVLMDWGLPVLAAAAARDASEPRCCGLAMRHPLLVSRSRALYLLLCAFNLALCFVWALAIFSGVPGYGLGMFFFEMAEVARRTAWAVFRIEWEVVCKVWTKSEETIALQPVDQEGGALSEEEMHLGNLSSKSDD